MSSDLVRSSLCILEHLLNVKALQSGRFKLARKIQAVYSNCPITAMVSKSFHKVSESSFDVLAVTPVKNLAVASGRKIQVDTVLNGISETVNVARCGDYIICGVSNELYVLKPETVATNYKYDESTDTLTTNSPSRIVFQFTQSDMDKVLQKLGAEDEKLDFLSPWGSSMLLEVNDYIVFENSVEALLNDASTLPEQLVQGFFRVEYHAFLSSYAFV